MAVRSQTVRTVRSVAVRTAARLKTFLLYLLLGKSVKSLFKLLPEPKGRIVLHSMNMSFLNVQGNSSPIFWNAIDEVEIFKQV